MRPTDGRAITNPENAQNFSHAEIKQASVQMNPAGLDGAFEAWSGIAAAVTKAGEQFETAIQLAVDQDWEGAAADSATRGIRDFAERMSELGQSLDQQSQPLSAAADAAARFKAAVPDLIESSGTTGDPEARNTAEEQARGDMNTLYIEPYGNTAPEIPTLPPPVQPIAVGIGGIGVAIGNPSGTGSDEPTPSGTEQDKPTGRDQPSGHDEPTGQDEPAAVDKSTDQATPAEQGTPELSESDKPGKTEEAAAQQVSPASSQHNGTPTTPAGTTHTPAGPAMASPLVPTAYPATAPTAYTPLSLDSIPSRAATPSSPGAAPIYGSEPRPGTSVPGQPGQTSGTPGPQPVSGSAGRPGATVGAGYSGMSAPRTRISGTDDNEHDSPKYLRSEEHATDLIGTVEPTVPPVLGAD
ncbi:hypothetical protein ACLMAJ_01650 [Nocardia sp. KC 131]|uniref:WXG100 family type VII secretion target n=1 Tax=Nocardia arseniciresistens TaxID=3392119 RepID=UPI00398EEC84